MSTDNSYVLKTLSLYSNLKEKTVYSIIILYKSCIHLHSPVVSLRVEYSSTSPLMSGLAPSAAELLIAILTRHDTFRLHQVHGRQPHSLLVNFSQVTPVSALVVELSVTVLAVYHLLVELGVGLVAQLESE